MATPNVNLNINQNALINTPVSEKGHAAGRGMYNTISNANPHLSFEGRLLDKLRPKWLGEGLDLSRISTIKPSEVMNARAGDPNYTNKAFAEVADYLKNNKEYHRVGTDVINESAWDTAKREDPRLPSHTSSNFYRGGHNSSDWNEAYNRHYQIGSQIRYGGAYASNKDSTMVYNPNYYRRSANRQVPVYTSPETNLFGSMYARDDDGSSMVITDDDAKVISNIKESPFPEVRAILPRTDIVNADFSSVGSPGDLIFINDKHLNSPFMGGLSTGHELNHAYQLPSKHTQPIVRVSNNSIHPKQREAARYGLDANELMQGAAAFQQQHYRNTGSRVKRPEDFESELQKAVDNVQDYDSESRRFLDYVRYLKNLHPDVYDEVRNKMPLIVRNGRIPGYDKKYKSKVVG